VGKTKELIDMLLNDTCFSVTGLRKHVPIFCLNLVKKNKKIKLPEIDQYTF